MKLKPLLVIVAVLAALSAAVFWAGRPVAPASADPRVGRPLADPAAIAPAAKLRFSDQGKTIVLTREPDGSWSDTSYFGLPADFSKLSSFVSDLTAAKIQRFVTANPDRLARLEFKDTKIEFLDPSGRSLWSVTLGKSPDSGGRFVRFGDEPRAYLADLNAWLDTEAKNWANAQLVDLKPDDIAKVDLSFDPAGRVTVSRTNKNAPWTAAKTPAGEKVSADKIASVLAALGTLRFTDTSDPADTQVAAAKKHLRAIVLTGFDGVATLIEMGREPELKIEKAGKRESGKPDAKGAKKAEPEYETVPAGPVFVFIASSKGNAPINGLMRKRAFQVDEYTFTGLPQKADEFFEPAGPAK